MPDLQDRIDQLEERLAFQDDSLQKLDDALSSQQQQLLLLERKIDLMLAQMHKLEAELPGAGSTDPADEKPPHY